MLLINRKYIFLWITGFRDMDTDQNARRNNNNRYRYKYYYFSSGCRQLYLYGNKRCRMYFSGVG